MFVRVLLCILLRIHHALRLNEDEVTLNEEEEDLPDDGWQDDEAQGEEDLTLRDTAFKNIVLVVHCKMGTWNLANASAVCHERFRLFRQMKMFFPEVLFWTLEDCGDSPHLCIPPLVERFQNRDGLLYMHFDALLKPEVMQTKFDKGAIGVFNEQEHLNFEEGEPKKSWLWAQTKGVRNAYGLMNSTRFQPEEKVLRL